MKQLIFSYWMIMKTMQTHIKFGSVTLELFLGGQKSDISSFLFSYNEENIF